MVQDESIRLMDESCGYIEQVDDNTVFGFVSVRDVGANLTTTRRKGKESNPARTMSRLIVRSRNR